MNDDATNNTTHQTINIKNQSTPDATISNTSNPSANAAADIAPNANSLSLGLKTDTDIFLKGNVNNMANKDKINTNPDPDAPDTDIPENASQDSGSTDSNSPYSLINCKFAPYSATTMKNQKNKENKIDSKDTFNAPLPCPQLTRHWYPQWFFPIFFLHRLLSPIFIQKLKSILQNNPQYQKIYGPQHQCPRSWCPLCCWRWCLWWPQCCWLWCSLS